MTKKNYIQPALEVLTVNATYSVCAGSSTESFSIISPGPIGPGDAIGADEGR